MPQPRSRPHLGQTDLWHGPARRNHRSSRRTPPWPFLGLGSYKKLSTPSHFPRPERSPHHSMSTVVSTASTIGRSATLLKSATRSTTKSKSFSVETSEEVYSTRSSSAKPGEEQKPSKKSPRPGGRSGESPNLRGEGEDRLGRIIAQGGAAVGATINPSGVISIPSPEVSPEEDRAQQLERGTFGR